jgi:hypothetical protein
VTEPIRLVLPNLFQDRLAKLTEHATHLDMVCVPQSCNTTSGSLASPSGCNGNPLESVDRAQHGLSPPLAAFTTILLLPATLPPG